MIGARLDAALLDAVDAVTLAERLGLGPLRRSGSQIRGRRCPGRTHSRDGFVMNAETGAWRCHPCGVAGGRAALVARAHGLDVTADFPRVLQLVAEISGTPTSDAEVAALAARRRRDAEARRDADDRARAAAVAALPARWAAMSRDDRRGWHYLLRRGCDPVRLRDADRLRFARDGSPCVPCWGAAGELLNIAMRRLAPGDGPKVITARGCSTACTLVGRLGDLREGRDAVLVEGVVDALTAARVWRDAVPVGASGAGRLAFVAGLVAARLAATGGRLLVVPDRDAVGHAAARAAGRAAVDAGLAADRVIFVDIGAHPDLNLAWCGGWVPAEVAP